MVAEIVGGHGGEENQSQTLCSDAAIVA
jgi:hypothetical protein